MTVAELVNKLGLEVFSGSEGLDRIIDGASVSDLLSDVMGNADQGNIWITLQVHKNITAVALLKEISCIILVNNHKPSPEAIEQSNAEKIPLLGTTLPAYEITGRIYSLLNHENV